MTRQLITLLWVVSLGLAVGGCCLCKCKCKPRPMTIEEEAMQAAEGNSVVLDSVRYNNRLRRTDVDEAEILADKLMSAYPERFTRGSGLDLVRCYDAVKLSSTEAALAKLPGSHAFMVLAGETDGVFLQVPYTNYRPGKYIVVCRLQSEEMGKLCTVEMARGDGASHSADVEGYWKSRGVWLEEPMCFEVTKRSRLKINVRGKGVPIAVDRLYVFKVRDAQD